MHVYFDIERIEGLREAELDGVRFDDCPVCPICESAAITEIAELHQSLRTSWCTRCTHVFRGRKPVQSWYDDWYETSWDRGNTTERRTHRSGGDQQGLRPPKIRALRSAGRELWGGLLRRSGTHEVFDFCRQVVTARSRVLDVGCGYGGVLRPFVTHGCAAFGIEPSRHRAEAARYLGVRVASIPVERLEVGTFGSQFDLVLANHVLEHVVEPYEFLAGIRPVLKPGGWLYIAVPNADTDFLLQHFFYALHVHCFSRHSLSVALQRSRCVIHRSAEDHQIRILARYEPDNQVETLSTDGREYPPPDSIVDRTLGYRDHQNGTTFCKWSVLPWSKALGHAHEVEFSPDPHPRRERVLRFRSDEVASLPIVFFKENSEDPVQFWVK
jgi:SAM-dependent methyltransferase